MHRHASKVMKTKFRLNTQRVSFSLRRLRKGSPCLQSYWQNWSPLLIPCSIQAGCFAMAPYEWWEEGDEVPFVSVPAHCSKLNTVPEQRCKHLRIKCHLTQNSTLNLRDPLYSESQQSTSSTQRCIKLSCGNKKQARHFQQTGFSGWS